jgi:type I restriction enzyme S subunit
MRASATLGELAARGGGGIRTGPFGSQLHRSDYVEHPDATPVVMPKDMIDGRIDTSSIARIDNATVDRLSQHLLRTGDIVLARRGDIGRRAWVGEVEDGWLCGTGSMRISLRDSQEVRPRFVYYYLATEAAVGWLEGHSVGATMSNLSAGVVEQLPIACPDLRDQDLIVNVLDTLGDLIENNRRRIEILDEIGRLTYREWFVRLRFPGHEDVELVESDLCPVPEGWEVTTLADLVSTQYGYTESARADPVGPRYLRGMDMNKTSYIDWSAVPFCPISGEDKLKFSVDVGDVFVIRMADPGKVGICETEIDGVFASYLVRLRPRDERIGSYFLFYTLSDQPYQSWVTGASTGATRKSVSATVMTEPQIVLPPRPVQRAFEEVVRPARALLTNLLAQNSVLRDARNLLLARLVSGQLDISDLELDLAAVG